MGSQIQDIIQVQASIEGSSPTRASFGVPLFLATHDAWTDAYREYTDVASMLDDGFTVQDSAYKMAAAAMSQAVRVEKFMIGRVVGTVAQTLEIDIAGMVAGDVDVTLVIDRSSTDSTNTVTTTWNTDAATTADDLVIAINAAYGDSPASSAAGVITIVSTDLQDRWHVATSVGSVEDVTASDPGYLTAANAVLAETSAFYAIAADLAVAPVVSALAGWVLADGCRIYIADPMVQDPADFAATGDALRDATNNRTAVLVTKSRFAYPAAAWLGEGLPFDPGSQTWALKSLAGIVVDDWSATERTAAEDYNGNHYTRVKGLNVTRWGTMASGDFIDEIRTIDYASARVSEALYSVLTAPRKVPYTDSGTQVLISAARATMLRLAAQGAVVESSVNVTAPKVEDVDPLDKAARIYKTMIIDAVFQGAIHQVRAQITITP